MEEVTPPIRRFVGENHVDSVIVFPGTPAPVNRRSSLRLIFMTNHMIIVGIKLSTTLPDPRQLGARSQGQIPEKAPDPDTSDQPD